MRISWDLRLGKLYIILSLLVTGTIIINCNIKPDQSRIIQIDLKEINGAEWELTYKQPITWANPSHFNLEYVCYADYIKIFIDSTLMDSTWIKFIYLSEGIYNKEEYSVEVVKELNNYFVSKPQRKLLKIDSIIYKSNNYLEYYYLSDFKSDNFIDGLYSNVGKNFRILFKIEFTNKYTIEQIHSIIFELFNNMDIKKYGQIKPRYEPCL